MGHSSGHLAQALSNSGSRAGAASRGGKSSRGPSEGAAAASVSAGGMKAAGKGVEGKLKGKTVQQAAEELDSVIQTINQVRLQLLHNKLSGLWLASLGPPLYRTALHLSWPLEASVPAV